jgi:hypothetical protein
VPGVLAAATGSDWNAGGSIFTFYFPVGLFVVVATILYLLFSRPHKRIPNRRRLASAHAAAGPERTGTLSGDSAVTGTGYDSHGDRRGDSSPPPESSRDDSEASG